MDNSWKKLDQSTALRKKLPKIQKQLYRFYKEITHIGTLQTHLFTLNATTAEGNCAHEEAFSEMHITQCKIKNALLQLKLFNDPSGTISTMGDIENDITQQMSSIRTMKLDNAADLEVELQKAENYIEKFGLQRNQVVSTHSMRNLSPNIKKHINTGACKLQQKVYDEGIRIARLFI